MPTRRPRGARAGFARPRSLAFALIALLAVGAPAQALVYASDEPPADAEPPPDFPYWDSVGQFNWEGPSLVYLGGGFVLTAQHVGLGQVVLGERTFLPVRASVRGLLSESGRPADAIVFRIDASEGLPDLPLLPLAESPPAPDEEVLMIGFGRGGQGQLVAIDEEHLGRRWSDERRKRWGTNRAQGDRPMIDTGEYTSRAFITRFDRQTLATATPYEAQPAVGDSGGAVFVHRPDGWKLAGIMLSVESHASRPTALSVYGDHAYHLDITDYATEIRRYGRPSCANGYDDDGDGRIDHPDDPDCVRADLDGEILHVGQPAPQPPEHGSPAWIVAIASLGLTIVLVRRSLKRR